MWPCILMIVNCHLKYCINELSSRHARLSIIKIYAHNPCHQKAKGETDFITLMVLGKPPVRSDVSDNPPLAEQLLAIKAERGSDSYP